MFDLKAFRTEKNILQEDLIKILGVSQSFISQIESGVKKLPKVAYKKLYNLYGEELNKYEIQETFNPKTNNDMLLEITALRNEIALLKELLSAKNEIIERLKSENQALKNSSGLNKQAV